MAVVGNLFVNIAAKTSEFSKGIAGVVERLQRLPLAGRLSAIALSGAMVYEFGRIAKQAMFRFAETRESIYSITKSFRELELSAARALAPVVNVLAGILDTKLKQWTEESSTGMSAFGAVAGVVGGTIQAAFNGVEIVFRLMASAVTTVWTIMSSIVESVMFLASFGQSDFSWTKMFADSTASLWKDASNSIYDMGQQPSAFQAGISGTVNGRRLTETGTMGSEELLMIARQQVTLLRDISNKVGGVR